MRNKKLILAGLLAALTLPALQGCFPAVATGMAVGVMSAHDRRSTGVQTDDETSEWKANNRIPAAYKDNSHINFVSYNRRILITGEVPNEEAKQAIGAMAEKVEGTRLVYNELAIGPISSYATRSKDAVITSKIKARLVDTQQISANHIKVFTEGGIAYLMGIVSEREAKMAVNVARTTDSVRTVVNVMEILPDAEIRRIDSTLSGSNQSPAPVEKR